MPSRCCGREGRPLLVLAPGARELIDEARREGRGVVFASAHLGPWERVAASLVAAGRAADHAGPGELRPALHPSLRAAPRRRGACGSSGARAAAGATGAQGTGPLATTSGIVRTLRGAASSASRWTCARACHRARPPSSVTRRPQQSVRRASPCERALRSSWVLWRPPARALVITATRIPTSGLDSHGNEGARDLTMRINRELSRRILALPHAWVWMHERWNRLCRI